jgi:hypothetical protein
MNIDSIGLTDQRILPKQCVFSPGGILLVVVAAIFVFGGLASIWG